MKIDFHVHTAERSPCATVPESDQIQAAIACGLDAIAITDHYQLVDPSHLSELNRRYAPFRILQGIEICADDEDWLILGCYHPIFEQNHWSYPALYETARSFGGFIILAHPFRFYPGIRADLRRYPPDAIEGHSNNIRTENIPHIQRLAAELNIPLLANSDAHHTGRIGQYFNVLDRPAEDESSIFSQVRSGQFSLSTAAGN